VTPYIKEKGRADLIPDPEKEITEARYKKCVARALKDGKSLKQLEEAR